MLLLVTYLQAIFEGLLLKKSKDAGVIHSHTLSKLNLERNNILNNIQKRTLLRAVCEIQVVLKDSVL